MLATLNLPFSTVESFDDPLKTSASLLPPGNASIESGFAGMLRLRVDASQVADTPGGKLLPPGGSTLPTLHDTSKGHFGGKVGSFSVNEAPGQAALLDGAAAPQSVSASLQGISAGLASTPDPSAGLTTVLNEQPGTVPEPTTPLNEQPGTATVLTTESPQAPNGRSDLPSTVTEPPAGWVEPDLMQLLNGQVPVEPLPESVNVAQPVAPSDSTALVEVPDIALMAAVNYPASSEAHVGAATEQAVVVGAAARGRSGAAVNGDAASELIVDNRSVQKPLPQPAYTNGVAVALRAEEVLRADAGRLVSPLATDGLKKVGHSRGTESDAPLLRRDTAAVEVRAPLEASRRPEILPLLQVGSSGEAFTDIVRPRKVLLPNAQPNALQMPSFPAPAATAGGIAAGELGYTSLGQQATDLIGTHVRDPAWGTRVGERVLMMTGNQLKTAEIRLTPAELGPLRVQVSVDDGAAHVTFHAQHAVTRDAIEQALPRLREMLAENGLSLGQADVGDRGVAEGNRDGEGGGQLGHGESDAAYDGDLDAEQHSPHRPAPGLGLVDTFA